MMFIAVVPQTQNKHTQIQTEVTYLLMPKCAFGHQKRRPGLRPLDAKEKA